MSETCTYCGSLNDMILPVCRVCREHGFHRMSAVKTGKAESESKAQERSHE